MGRKDEMMHDENERARALRREDEATMLDVGLLAKRLSVHLPAGDQNTIALWLSAYRQGAVDKFKQMQNSRPGEVLLVRWSRHMVEDMGARTEDGDALISFSVSPEADEFGVSTLSATRKYDGMLTELKRQLAGTQLANADLGLNNVELRTRIYELVQENADLKAAGATLSGSLYELDEVRFEEGTSVGSRVQP
jgi:hypothetical protein